MTISQNRFGGQATVGRKYVDEPYNSTAGVLTGAGLIGAGAASGSKSKKILNAQTYQQKQATLKQERIKQNVSRLKPIHTGQIKSKATEAKFAGWLYGPEPKKRFQTNVNGKRIVATGRADAERVGGEINRQTSRLGAEKARLSNDIRSSAQELRSSKKAIASHGRKATRLKNIGRAGIGAGLATIGGSIYAKEKSRGTFRNQRQAIGA